MQFGTYTARSTTTQVDSEEVGPVLSINLKKSILDSYGINKHVCPTLIAASFAMWDHHFQF